MMESATPTLRDENYLHALSHDLREPARMISQLLKLVKVKSERHLDDDSTEYLNYAIDASDKMDDMIKSLSELNKAKLYQEEDTSFKTSEIFDRVSYRHRDELKFLNTAVQYSVDEECSGKAELVELILNELVLNSLKHAKPENGLEVKVDVKQEKSGISVTVEDNGQNLPDFWLKKAFDPFKKANKKTLNSGIGLTKLKILVEKFGGKISMVKTKGKNTCVYCTLS